MQWGLNQADGEGVEAYTEATEPGFGLYRKHGFEKCDEIVMIDGKLTDTCMVRPLRVAAAADHGQELLRN